MNPPVFLQNDESVPDAGDHEGDVHRIRDATAVDTDGCVSTPRDLILIDEAIADFWRSFKTDSDVKSFFSVLVIGAFQHLDEIDRIINDISRNWKLDRMAVVDRNIIRCAVFELLYLSDIPPTVTINEAIEIAKRYGTEDSPGFVNGILDRIADEFADTGLKQAP